VRYVSGLLSSAAARSFSGRNQRIAKEIENYMGRKPEATRNKNGDLIIQRGDKQIRFDINKYSPHEGPHFHIMRQRPNGKWTSATDQHYHLFKKD
jgi:hypothetical protein